MVVSRFPVFLELEEFPDLDENFLDFFWKFLHFKRDGLDGGFSVQVKHGPMLITVH